MKTIEQQAKEYANTNIEFFDSDSNPCVQPAFEAGANYVLECIEEVTNICFDEELRNVIEQLKK